MINTKFMTRIVNGRKLDFMFTFDERDNEYVNPYDFDCCQMWDDDENNTCGENVWLFGFGDDVDYDFMNKVGNKGKELAKLC